MLREVNVPLAEIAGAAGACGANATPLIIVPAGVE